MRILGRSDKVDLPQLGVYDIHAKVDTGAYTSSLHCQSAEVVSNVLEFVLLDEEHPEFTGSRFRFTDYEVRDIRNSFGEVERRFVIVTTMRIFDEDVTTEFSLCNRGSLKFPVLIGRKILRDRFLIDVDQKDLSFKQKRRKSLARKK
ncbi:MAG TPA: RimK/LysX family protein [Chryseolinea sp.]|nr:RimK/LysX family protein [Chryseolinea sp.]